jgi:hypothetical protein
MASKEEIKKAILDASGNPDVGIVRDNVDAWAEAVFALDNKNLDDVFAAERKVSDKEVRIVEAKETR